MTGKSIEFTWYFGELPEQDALIRVVNKLNMTLTPQINYFSLLNNDLKEKKAKFTDINFSKRAEPGDGEYLYSCHFFSMQKGVDNRFPESSLVISRASPENMTNVYNLTLQVNEACYQAQDDLILGWNKIIQDEVGWCYGLGCRRITFNLDFDLGPRILLSSADPVKAEQISSSSAAQNLRYYRANLASFKRVLEAQCFLSVSRYNLISQDLLKLTQACFDEAEVELPGKLVNVSSDRFIWMLPSSEDREHAYRILSNGGIIFDPEWFDIETYIPTSSTFKIPFPVQNAGAQKARSKPKSCWNVFLEHLR